MALRFADYQEQNCVKIDRGYDIDGERDGQTDGRTDGQNCFCATREQRYCLRRAFFCAYVTAITRVRGRQSRVTLAC